MNAIAIDGRWILISALGGSRLESFSFIPLLSKRIQLIGTTLRSRSLAYKNALVNEFQTFACPLFRSGKLFPVVDQVFCWTKVQEAHHYMEENRNIGKIILEIGRKSNCF